MEQKDNITVYLMSLQISKKNALISILLNHLFSTLASLSLKFRLPVPEFSGYHAAMQMNIIKTKD